MQQSNGLPAVSNATLSLPDAPGVLDLEVSSFTSLTPLTRQIALYVHKRSGMTASFYIALHWTKSPERRRLLGSAADRQQRS